MSSDRVLDYLTEELVVAKNIVTYRSLSHALGIHVNQAKNELAVYHSEHAGSSDAGYATFIVGGAPRVSYLDSVRDADKMAIDDEEMDEESEDVPETKITLVREADLETSKEQYVRIHFVHIYSLSPSPIHEPALLCEPAKNLRDAGKSIAAGFTVALGRITGPDWYIKKRTDLQQRRPSSKAKSSATATTSKNRLPGLSKAPSMTEDAKSVVKSEPKDVKPQIKDEPAKPAKPSGKLDFSKAKAKAKDPAAPALKPAPETRKIKAEPVEESLQAASSKAAVPKPEHKPSRSKNKSMSKLSDSEKDESATARTRSKSPLASKRTESTKSAAPVRRRLVISDDDEDEGAPKPPPPPPPRTKSAYKSSKAKTKDATPDDLEAEKELRAMMDIDDDQVMRVSHTPVSISEPATSPPTTDVEMEDREPEPEPEPEPARARARAPTRKTQRKPKKEVPVGRNGLKKRRVVKSRMTTDEKGYFVTEDYSSYESVDEETAEEAPPAAARKPAKGKGKKLTAPITVKDEEEAEEEKEKAAKPLAKSASTLKRKPSKPSVQKGGIASYFNKK